jgi:hypothetical protein
MSTRHIATMFDLSGFIFEFSEHVRTGNVPLENRAVDRYLEALSAWIADSDGYYLNQGIDPESVSPLRRFADAIVAATIYE